MIKPDRIPMKMDFNILFSGGLMRIIKYNIATEIAKNINEKISNFGLVIE